MVVKALLRGLHLPGYKRGVLTLAEAGKIIKGSEELLIIMEKEGEGQNIIVENQQAVAETAENGYGKARWEAPVPKASLDPMKKARDTLGGAEFLGKCFPCDQRGHSTADCTSGEGSDSEDSAAGAGTPIAKASQVQALSARATGTR